MVARKSMDDLIGKQLGDLLVLYETAQKGNHRMVACLCKCGRIRSRRACDLRNGMNTHCGNWKSHGFIAEHQCWCSMVSRCYVSTDQNYPRYGAHGIRVHQDWRDSFWKFICHIGPRYENDLSLDRIDNDGHYEPGNVRWATRETQCNNKRRSFLITHDGKTLSPAQWSRIVGLSRHAIRRRILRGIPPEVALTAPAYSIDKDSWSD